MRRKPTSEEIDATVDDRKMRIITFDAHTKIPVKRIRHAVKRAGRALKNLEQLELWLNSDEFPDDVDRNAVGDSFHESRRTTIVEMILEIDREIDTLKKYF